MIQLKEWAASEIEEYDDARLELAEDGKIDCTRVYIKEDVDKVIADLEYKRCLAMASYWVAVSYQCVDDKHRQRAKKHRYKWLELAKQFKEAK